MAIKYIDLICDGCEKSFKKTLRDYKHEKRKGTNKNFCNRNCYLKNHKSENSDFLYLIRRLKTYCKKIKRDFDLDVDFLNSLWEKQNGTCPYTNYKMILYSNQKNNPYSASLDRIDSTKGYVKENVEFICLAINYAKNGFKKQEIIEFLKNIKK